MSESARAVKLAAVPKVVPLLAPLAASDTKCGMRYRLIALDMDDTLLNSQRQIGPENLACLRRLGDAGLKIVLCSGRPTPSLVKHSLLVHGDSPDAHQIAFNGASITEVSTGREIFRRPLDPAAGRIVLQAARDHGVLLQAYGSQSFFVELGDRRAEAYAKSVDLPFVLVDSLEPIIERGSLKLLMNAPRPKLLAVREALENHPQRSQFHMVFSKPEYLEFIDPGVNKGTGLRELCAHLNIPLDQTIGVGDSENDKELLQTAGLGLAVGNATAEIRAVADAVLRGSNEDPFIQEIWDTYL